MRWGIAGFIVLSVACGGVAPGDPARPTSVVRFEGGTSLRVAVADTPETRRRGLMGVEQLPADQGMAFLFDGSVDSTFWMKDTLVPLSIAFVDADGTITTIRDMEPCVEDPCPRYGADGPFTLAIEANRGWFEEHGVGVGDVVELQDGSYA